MAILCAPEGGSCDAALRREWEGPVLDLQELNLNQITPQGSLPPQLSCPYIPCSKVWLTGAEVLELRDGWGQGLEDTAGG